MQQESRVTKVLLNAKVNLIYYLAFLFISFFTRKIFLEKLGTDFVGLFSTLGNLLGMLNLAELGIGSSIAMVMYKPLFDRDQEKINDIISVLGYLYSRVGMVVLAGGIVMAMFLPMMFAHTIFEYAVIYAMFFSMFTSSLIGYFINYRQFLFNADQKGYEITRYSQAIGILKVLIQVTIAYYTPNYYCWIAIEFACGIIYAFLLNWRLHKVYPWLKVNIDRGKRMYSQYPQIMTKARQVFIHSLAWRVRSQLLPFLMYSFTSLHMIALYANYTLVSDKINGLIGNFLSSTGAGIGNLIAEGNTNKIMHVYWELFAIKFFIAIFVSYSVFALVDPFITIWLGKQYLIEKNIVAILVAINFLGQISGCNTQFKNAYGLVWDVWAPVAAMAVMIPLALVGGYYWGLPGVLLGNLVSHICVLAVWHPYMLFHYGFKRSIWEYWRNYFKHLSLGAIAIFASLYINQYLPFHDCTNFGEWAIYSIFVCLVFSALLLPMMYVFCPGSKDAAVRAKRIILHRGTK